MNDSEFLQPTSPLSHADIAPGADVSSEIVSDSIVVDRAQDFCSISDAHPVLERIVGVCFGVFMLAAVLIAASVMYFVFDFTSVMWLSIFGGVLGLAFFAMVVMVFWPAIEHRHIMWRLNEDGLEIRRGVFWRHQVCVPLARVQHADVSQGPLQRQYGLGTLTVNTAGTQNASVSLEGLAHETAMDLRDQLIRQGKARNVV